MTPGLSGRASRASDVAYDVDLKGLVGLRKSALEHTLHRFAGFRLVDSRAVAADGEHFAVDQVLGTLVLEVEPAAPPDAQKRAAPTTAPLSFHAIPPLQEKKRNESEISGESRRCGVSGRWLDGARMRRLRTE